MIQCNTGHFFDESKHSSCPYCAVPLDLGSPNPTVPAVGAGAAGVKTTPLRPTPPPGPPAGATKRLVEEQLGIDPVVGWLVCVDGPDRGRDFRIRSENNFIGRDSSMDIALAGDDTISRQKHASIAFEPAGQSFWLLPGDSRGLTYVNDKMVMSPVQLAARDVIRLGKTRLMLVPFVDASFSWQ
jgi:hypothetical protein